MTQGQHCMEPLNIKEAPPRLTSWHSEILNLKTKPKPVCRLGENWQGLQRTSSHDKTQQNLWGDVNHLRWKAMGGCGQEGALAITSQRSSSYPDTLCKMHARRSYAESNASGSPGVCRSFVAAPTLVQISENSALSSQLPIQAEQIP